MSRPGRGRRRPRPPGFARRPYRRRRDRAAGDGRQKGRKPGEAGAPQRLISERTGEPIGGGLAFARDICHILDSLACYIGWLFPLWDAKRQTFADKIVSTVVVPE